MKGGSINRHINVGRFLVDVERVMTFLDANGEVHEINLGTKKFKSELNIRLTRIDELKKFM